MEHILLNLLLIAFCFTFIYDYAQFPRNAAARLYSVLFKKDISQNLVKLPKLLECSFCATTWTSLAYLLMVYPRAFWLCLVAAFCTKYILYCIETIDAILTNIFVFLQRIINKTSQ